MSAPLPLAYEFTPGQPVRILSGPFANQPAQVAKVSEDWGSVWVQDRGERVELITQLANLSPCFQAPKAATSAAREAAAGETGTNTGRPAGRNGEASTGPEEPDEPDEEPVIQSPPS